MLEPDDDLIEISPEALALASPAERDLYQLYLLQRAVRADDWRTLLPAIDPKDYESGSFAPHHEEFWNWVWAIEPGVRPRPFVGIWPRGGAKSTSAEAAVLALGARGKRGYCLYVCETQDQADDHVANITALLESKEIELAYPELGEKLTGKFGQASAWRRNRVRTSTGFTVDAIGLDTAARGIKLEQMRPDLMVFDDIDRDSDSELVTNKKIKTLTRSLIPAGAPKDCAILAIQNLVHENSIFARLADGRADFLRKRIVSGPIPALVGMEVAAADDGYVITAGTPSWAGGQDVAVCQGMMDDMGLTAFVAECQHETVAAGGEVFSHLDFASIGVTEAQLPALVRSVVWLDPAVTSTDASDSQGIICDGLGTDGLIYRLWAWEGRATPLAAMKRAITKALEWGAMTVGVETDQGGDTWQSVYWQACEQLREEGILVGSAPRFTEEKAGAGHGGKLIRAQKMLVDYERFRFRHLKGTHVVLEKALHRFPKTKPFDLVDTAYWAWRYLNEFRPKRKSTVQSAVGQQIGTSSWN